MAINVFNWDAHMDRIVLCGHQLAPVVPAYGPVADMNKAAKSIEPYVPLRDGNEDVTGVWGAECGLANTHIYGTRN